MQVDVALIGLVVSTLGTVVVAVGVLAALRQLRYLRHGNELATLTDLQAHFEAPQMREAREFVRTQLAAALDDPTFIAELRAVPPGPRAQYVTRVGNFFEMLATYVQFGALSEGMSMVLWGVIAERNWQLTRAAIVILRESQGTVLDFFEDFAQRAPVWTRGPRAAEMRRRLLRDLHLEPFAAHEGERASPT